VTRIDDALRLVRGDAAKDDPIDKTQHHFISAWPTKEDGTQGDSDAERPSRLLERPAPGPSKFVQFSSEWRERLAASPDGDPNLIEQFRRLAATLHHAHINNGLRSVMVTSALPGDGKTLTSINLAMVLAESYRYNVLLIDADLRRPSIPSVIEGHGSGLSETLRAPTEHKLALVSMTSRLTLLPAGQPIANSIEALTSPRMRQILDEASRRFDWVILDAPPVGPATDARLLAQMVGGTLFVLRAGSTPHRDVKNAIDTIGREQILGVVLNGVEPDTKAEYYYGPTMTKK
jgi:protein-tyrosine kinase